MEPTFKLNKIVRIERTGEKKPVMDIEVDHPDHLFIAKSENGALGVSHNSAQISLSNLSDDRMRSAKSGQWWNENPNFAFANNSVAYTEKPDIGIFMKEWIALYESKSGERGIFNRDGIKRHIRRLGIRNPDHDFGVNPCISGDSVINVELDGSQQTIRLKDLVSTFNEFQSVKVKSSLNGITGYFHVSNAALTKKNAEIIEIVDEDSGKVLRCTPDHQIATKNRGWVEAVNLKEDDVLIFGD